MTEQPLDQPLQTSMLDGSTFLERLEAVERRLAEHAASDAPEGLTDPDPDTPEERWEAGQVWAHVAEFVPYWHDQMRSVIGTYDGTPVPFGRVKTDAGRVAAIEVGRHAPIGAHMDRVREALAELRRYLDGLTSAEWNAVGLHQTRGEMDVEAIVERFVVSHLEEHADQLDRLRAAA
jgi:hypothetical protein